MTDKPRLIERAFPLKQTSLSSVHEKNVRHGHISTLHIWPARRPLAACRAALLATLLPDPGTPEKRRKLCERIGGTVVEKIERKKMPNGRIVPNLLEIKNKANIPLVFRVQIELGDGQTEPDDETVQTMNVLLADIKDNFQFE